MLETAQHHKPSQRNILKGSKSLIRCLLEQVIQFAASSIYWCLLELRVEKAQCHSCICNKYRMRVEVCFLTCGLTCRSSSWCFSRNLSFSICSCCSLICCCWLELPPPRTPPGGLWGASGGGCFTGALWLILWFIAVEANKRAGTVKQPYPKDPHVLESTEHGMPEPRPHRQAKPLPRDARSTWNQFVEKPLPA